MDTLKEEIKNIIENGRVIDWRNDPVGQPADQIISLIAEIDGELIKIEQEKAKECEECIYKNQDNKTKLNGVLCAVQKEMETLKVEMPIVGAKPNATDGDIYHYGYLNGKYCGLKRLEEIIKEST